MGTLFPGERKARIASYLAHERTGVLYCCSCTSTIGPQGVWAIPVWYRSRDLEVGCLVAPYADIAHRLKQDSRVLFDRPGVFRRRPGLALYSGNGPSG